MTAMPAAEPDRDAGGEIAAREGPRTAWPLYPQAARRRRQPERTMVKNGIDRIKISVSDMIASVAFFRTRWR